MNFFKSVVKIYCFTKISIYKKLLRSDEKERKHMMIYYLLHELRLTSDICNHGNNLKMHPSYLDCESINTKNK